MCGIIAIATAKKTVCDSLIDGLQRLEYRGYDSSGLAIFTAQNHLQRVRAVGDVQQLKEKLQPLSLQASVGIAHTRWATHGTVNEINAHPHFSNNEIAIVHNGIVDNCLALKTMLEQHGYKFITETDSEVIAHLIHFYSQQHTLRHAIQKTTQQLEGAYAIAVLSTAEPEKFFCTMKGASLVIGHLDDGYAVASDVVALLSLTQTVSYLSDHQLVEISENEVTLYDTNDKIQSLQKHPIDLLATSVDKGTYQHHMLKEIHEQVDSTITCLQDKIDADAQLILPEKLTTLFKDIQSIQIIACGSSYHAGLVAKDWIENYAEILCRVDIASEFHQHSVLPKETLFIFISQSGETADILTALHRAKATQARCLSLCNVPSSSLTRSTDYTCSTEAGPEISVASTKALTAQLTTLLWLTLGLQVSQGKQTTSLHQAACRALSQLPHMIQTCFEVEDEIKTLAQQFIDQTDCFCLGNATLLPIAQEAALKLKETSYIHAEALAAGEMKHGPLALIHENMPCIVLISQANHAFKKLTSNLEAIKTRSGKLYFFSDQDTPLDAFQGAPVIRLKQNPPQPILPIVLNILLQMLSYHIAIAKGINPDRPRNLAKSVTVG